MRRKEQENQQRRAGFFPELIFAWRRRRGEDAGRMVIAGISAALVFATLGALLHVEGRTLGQTTLRQSSARLVILRGDDEVARDLIQWAREQSPDAVTWEPAVGDTLAVAMREAEDKIRKASRYQPRLQPVPVRAAEPDQDPVMPLIALELPPVEMPIPVVPENGDTTFEVRPVFAPSESLKARWRDLEGPWPVETLRKLVTRKAVFSVAVDGAGAVEFCLPVRGTGTEFDAELRQRLRSHTLHPGESDGLSWGTVSVSIKAVGEEAP